MIESSCGAKNSQNYLQTLQRDACSLRTAVYGHAIYRAQEEMARFSFLKILLLNRRPWEGLQRIRKATDRGATESIKAAGLPRVDASCNVCDRFGAVTLFIFGFQIFNEFRRDAEAERVLDDWILSYRARQVSVLWAHATMCPRCDVSHESGHYETSSIIIMWGKYIKLASWTRTCALFGNQVEDSRATKQTEM